MLSQHTGRYHSVPFLSVLIVVCVLLAGCEQRSSLTVVHLQGKTMGTTYSIQVVAPPESLAPVTLERNVEQILTDINQQMSTYITDSAISRFNQLAVNEWFPVSQAFLAVLQLSQAIAQKSQGYFDITIGPLVELWGFGAAKVQQLPSQEAILAAKAKVGWRQLIIDAEQQRIQKKAPLRLDVSAVAKGFAVDQLAKRLESLGVAHYLVEIGGEIRVKGHNAQGHTWRIGIEEPSLLQHLPQQQAQKVVFLTHHAVATSGDYRNYIEENGQRFSHTINPVTGKPVKHRIASVTVIAETAAEADALATALNAIGEEKAQSWAEAESIAAFFILYNTDLNQPYRVVYSPAFEPFLEVPRSNN